MKRLLCLFLIVAAMLLMTAPAQANNGFGASFRFNTFGGYATAGCPIGANFVGNVDPGYGVAPAFAPAFSPFAVNRFAFNTFNPFVATPFVNVNINRFGNRGFVGHGFNGGFGNRVSGNFRFRTRW